MSADISGTSWDQCVSTIQYYFTSTETRRLVRTDSPGRPPRLSHSYWTLTVTPGWWCEASCPRMSGWHIKLHHWRCTLLSPRRCPPMLSALRKVWVLERWQTPSTGLRHPSFKEGAGKWCSESGEVVVVAVVVVVQPDCLPTLVRVPQT